MFVYSLYVSFSESVIVNITKFIVDQVNLSVFESNVPQSLEVWFTFPSFWVTGYYELDVSAPDFHIYGTGPFNITFNNVTLYSKGNFSTTKRNSLNMTDLSFLININSTNVNLENILGGGESGSDFNNALSDLLPTIINNYQIKISEFVKEYAIPLIDICLRFFSVPDLIMFIKEFAY
uniref:Lipid-binding serum glycoprotein C-terminal domain-containing protein n=1 Tax=Clastoptera arizonana TaxID=38151 RepID=A0A1B6D364_9HEMI